MLQKRYTGGSMARDPDAKTYGAWLLRQRRRRAWTAKDLSEATGIALSSIYHYKNGSQSPNAENDRLLRAVFGDPPAYIFEPRAELEQEFFFIRAGVNEAWQRELNYEVLSSLHEAHQYCDQLPVTEDYSWEEHRKLWNDVLRRKRAYAGGLAVVSPWVSDQLAELNRLASEFGGPVIFLDHSATEAAVPDNVWRLSFDDKKGGALAAAELARVAGRHRVRRALVVSGAANVKEGRVRFFTKGLEERLAGNCRVTVSNEGGFDFDKGAQATEKLLDTALKKNDPIDAVFYTADSMTLGGMEPIARLEREQGTAPIVIGYDGVSSTLALVEKGKIVNVVVQNAPALAKRAVDQLCDLCAGRPTRQMVSIAPTLFR